MTFRSIAAVTAVLFALSADAIDASDRYRSPRNPERKVRQSTELIVLHTTEAPARGSLDKLSDRGECHFCVTDDGSVYRIVDRDKIAFHAGRSMWNGKEDVDEFSVGIECVGYHDKPMPVVQLRAIRDLVKELQSMYRLSDDKVICHGHVAYGAPNKWHRFRHRGRKRCGMLFATPAVRRILRLKTRPARDPDVRAGRLRNADEELRKTLYGKTDPWKSHYANVTDSSSSRSSGGFFSWFGFGRSESKPSEKPEVKAALKPTPKSAPKPAKSVSSPAPKAAPKATAKESPKPAGMPVAGHAPAVPVRPKSRDDLLAMGYIARGSVTKEQTAAKLAGDKWNSASTYYVIRNKVIPGDQIDPAHIEFGMTIWTKK